MRAAVITLFRPLLLSNLLLLHNLSHTNSRYSVPKNVVAVLEEIIRITHGFAVAGTGAIVLRAFLAEPLRPTRLVLSKLVRSTVHRTVPHQESPAYCLPWYLEIARRLCSISCDEYQ